MDTISTLYPHPMQEIHPTFGNSLCLSSLQDTAAYIIWVGNTPTIRPYLSTPGWFQSAKRITRENFCKNALSEHSYSACFLALRIRFHRIMTDIYAGSSDLEDSTGEPCHNFRLDKDSPEFGMCKCGFLRADHGTKKENQAEKMLTRLKQNNDERRKETTDYDISEPGDRACNRFRLDVSANEFGMCKCGYKRADHEDQKENKAQKALQRLKQSNADRMKDAMPVDSDGPCQNYRVDTTADKFGTCVCGFSKADHSKTDENVAAKFLAAMTEKNKKKNEMADLEAIGITDDVEEPPDAIDTPMLDKAEETAAQPATSPKSKKTKKKGGNCVVS